MNSQLLTLFLSGDVMTGRGIDQILPHPSSPRIYEPYVKDARDYVELAERINGPIERPKDFDYIWGNTLEELQYMAPDLRIINLETSVTTSADYDPKGINYRMHPKNIDCLKAAKIDGCVLANNHVLDWGVAGLYETLQVLKKSGLHHTGAGHNRELAQAPAIMNIPSETNGGRVIVFSFGLQSSGISRHWGANTHRSGVNLLPNMSNMVIDNIAEQVRGIRQHRDVVIASIHWGSNWGYGISDNQSGFARALIDHAGIDMVHGHSSHHVKGLEVYRGHLIIYGCGDLLNDYEGIKGHEQYRDDLGLMYFPTLDCNTGCLQQLTMSPTHIRRLQINRASHEEAQWLQNVLNREGKAFGTGAMLDENDRLSLQWDMTGGHDGSMTGI